MELLIHAVVGAIAVWIAYHFIAPIVGLLVALVVVVWLLLQLSGRGGRV